MPQGCFRTASVLPQGYLRRVIPKKKEGCRIAILVMRHPFELQ